MCSVKIQGGFLSTRKNFLRQLVLTSISIYEKKWSPIEEWTRVSFGTMAWSEHAKNVNLTRQLLPKWLEFSPTLCAILFLSRHPLWTEPWLFARRLRTNPGPKVTCIHIYTSLRDTAYYHQLLIVITFRRKRASALYHQKRDKDPKSRYKSANLYSDWSC